MITITSFFDQLKSVNDFLKSSTGRVMISLVAVLWALLNIRQWNKFEYKLNSKNIRMNLVVGDVLKRGSLIVPISNEFDASLGGLC